VHNATGCPVCGRESTTTKRTDSQEKFIKNCVEVHRDRYDYSKTVYVSSRVPVVITCGVHGDFVQVAEYHRNGSGCVPCSTRSSRPQVDINGMLVGRGITTITDYKLPSGLEIDVYCPDRKVGFEYDGLYWHSNANGKSSSYHINKTTEAALVGIELIHIFEGDWVYSNDFCRESILSKVGLHVVDLHSAALVSKKVLKDECDALLCRQGNIPSIGGADYVGVFLAEELVGFAVVSTTPMEGVLLHNFYSHAEETATLASIVSYLRVHYAGAQTVATTTVDTRCCRPSVYLENGFTKVSQSLPRKYYTKNQRKYTEDELHKLSQIKSIDPSTYYEIYDCGETTFSIILR